MTEYGRRTDHAWSGCANARGLGLWKAPGGYTLGRKIDGVQLPGIVLGNVDRARRSWHALSVLHTDAEDIILSLGIDPRTEALVADWGRFCDA